MTKSLTYSKKIRQGKFIPQNPNKYKGDVKNIVFRSSYEKKFMRFCDLNPDITEWGSEEFYIPYFNPIKKKTTKYYPDFFIKIRGKTFIIEVKPKRYVKRPETPKRKTKKYFAEVEQFLVNQEKWKAANAFCEKNNLTFKIITETDLGIGKKH